MILIFQPATTSIRAGTKRIGEYVSEEGCNERRFKDQAMQIPAKTIQLRNSGIPDFFDLMLNMNHLAEKKGGESFNVYSSFRF